MGLVGCPELGVASPTCKPFCGKGSPVELEPLKGCSIFATSEMMAKTEHRTTEPAVVNVKAGNVVERVSDRYNRTLDLLGRVDRLYERTPFNTSWELRDNARSVLDRLNDIYDDLSDEAASCLPADPGNALERVQQDINHLYDVDAAGLHYPDWEREMETLERLYDRLSGSPTETETSVPT